MGSFERKHVLLEPPTLAAQDSHGPVQASLLGTMATVGSGWLSGLWIPGG